MLEIRSGNTITIVKVENGQLVVMKLNRREYEKREKLHEQYMRRMNRENRRKR